MTGRRTAGFFRQTEPRYDTHHTAASYTRKDSLYLGVLDNTIYTHDERGGRWMTYFYEYDGNGVLTSISYKNINNIVPVEYFIGMGHLMEEFVNHDSLTFKPLALVLEEQYAN